MAPAADASASSAGEALKRPQTAYFLWLNENRAEVVKELGGVTKGSEVSKKAGEMWKALSEEQRAPYEQRAKEAKEAYDAKKPAKPAPEAKEAGTEGRKRPLTPVFAFIQAKRAEIQAMDGVKGLGEVSKKGTELYNALPEEEKAKWQTRYDEEMKEYKAWAESEEGKAALVEKRGAAQEKRAAKQEKKDKKAAKEARKGKREEAANAGEGSEEGSEDGEEGTEQAAGEPASKKRPAEAPAAAPPAKAAKGKGRGRGASAAPGSKVEVAPQVLKQAEALGTSSSGLSYTVLLEKLLSTDGLKGKVSDADALASLKKHEGLLNKARADLKALAGA